ncbi:MAG: class I SAM-dependent methyltransferase [Candidatus Omnitrophica bacterium]|nr:class I SAM-dependent methyltransferase [Candidatus Omnitrophota bacterium]
MKLVDSRCPICGSYEDYTVIYKKNFDLADLNEDIFSARRLPDRVHYQIVKCNKDGMVRSSPTPEGAVIDGLYRQSKFTYDEEVGSLTATYINALKDVLYGISKDANILEVGCGNGFILSALRNMGYKNVFGVEPSADASAKAPAEVRANIVTDVLAPGTFNTNTFGLIFFFQTLDHIYDPNFFLKICYNISQPGARIMAFNHDIESMQARMLKEKSPVIDIAHPYLYSADTIKKVFEKNGFEPVKIYSPLSIVSLRHLIRLIPMPLILKTALLNSRLAILKALLNQKIKIRLGNICLVAEKSIAKT